MWDDDEEIFPDALKSIDAELARTGFPDLLIVPALHLHESLLPDPALGVEQLTEGAVITINLVSKFKRGAAVLPTLPAGGRMRGRDFVYFNRFRSDPDARIELGSMQPIGRIDGLRPVMNLRQRMGVPALGIERIPVLRTVRRWLRG